MLKKDEIDFIQKYMVKKGERLDFSINDAPFIDVKIIKQTERTYRLTGLLIVAKINREDLEIVDEELVKRSLAPTKKIQLEDHDPNTIKWFEQGWIIKEIRFKKDGKTPDSQQYRMGFPLYKYQQEQLHAKEKKIEDEFTRWKDSSQMLAQVSLQFQSKSRQHGIQSCQTMISELCQFNISKLEDSSYFSAKWPMTKKLKYLHFISAFLQLCLQKEEFDWKEIGASYYKEIGGSKQFDTYKEEFIDHLESLTQYPATMLGMISLGKITPLYFSGQITGHYSSYQFGPVHALTDLAISEEEYSTNTTTMWLVENRAVLTRMAAEKNFIHDTNSLVICVDGHVRSSHKQCIVQLLKNSRIKQVLIWSDYDLDGLQIAKELYVTVSRHHLLPIKWITADHNVIMDWKEYEEHMQVFLKHKNMEQEEILGGASMWKKWINH